MSNFDLPDDYEEFDDEDFDDFNDPVDYDYLDYLQDKADQDYKWMQEQMTMEEYDER